MFNFVSGLILSLGLMGAFAQADSDLGGCRMHFKVQIDSTLFWQSGRGNGKLTCSDAAGHVFRSVPVQIEISGYGFGFGRFSYEGLSGNLGVVELGQIMGTYYVADANLAVGVGLGLSLDFYNQETGLSFGGKVKAGTGIGAAINGSTWKITQAQN
ncbi:MAG: hypothetical protein AB7F86_16695 [Bdellovibrionales bacterium]